MIILMIKITMKIIIINQIENKLSDKENNRYNYKINNEEFYEEEKKYLQKLEEDKTYLEKEKEREYLLRYPFFPLINSNSRKFFKKRNINDKKKIQTAFSCDKNISNPPWFLMRLFAWLFSLFWFELFGLVLFEFTSSKLLFISSRFISLVLFGRFSFWINIYNITSKFDKAIIYKYIVF